MAERQRWLKAWYRELQLDGWTWKDFFYPFVLGLLLGLLLGLFVGKSL